MQLDPEKPPIKKTGAGNWRIDHPYFEGVLFERNDRWFAWSQWRDYCAGKQPLRKQ